MVMPSCMLKVHEASTLHKIYKQQRKAGSRRSGPPRREHNTWLPGAQHSALKQITQVKLYRINRLYLRMCMYMCKHIHIQ